MDRRYSEMKLDGVKANDSREQQSKALVQAHLEHAKRQNRQELSAADRQRPGSQSGFKSEPTETPNSKARRLTAEASAIGLPPRRNRPRISLF